jgi:hypothetical protein
MPLPNREATDATIIPGQAHVREGVGSWKPPAGCCQRSECLSLNGNKLHIRAARPGRGVLGVEQQELGINDLIDLTSAERPLYIALGPKSGAGMRSAGKRLEKSGPDYSKTFVSTKRPHP